MAVAGMRHQCARSSPHRSFLPANLTGKHGRGRRRAPIRRLEQKLQLCSGQRLEALQQHVSCIACTARCPHTTACLFPFHTREGQYSPGAGTSVRPTDAHALSVACELFARLLQCMNAWNASLFVAQCTVCAHGSLFGMVGARAGVPRAPCGRPVGPRGSCACIRVRSYHFQRVPRHVLVWW